MYTPCRGRLEFSGRVESSRFRSLPFYMAYSSSLDNFFTSRSRQLQDQQKNQREKHGCECTAARLTQLRTASKTTSVVTLPLMTLSAVFTFIFPRR
jgi:hypothetical protein